MKLLITGGSGFLGYHLCNALASDYDEVKVLDVVAFNAEEYPSNVRFQDTNVKDRKSIEREIQGFDHVIHAAAALPLCPRQEILDINIQGTQNVMDAALQHKASRVVHISSTAVYGLPKVHPLYEHHALHGVGPYGVSKIAAEKICEHTRESGLCVSIIRPKTFIGTGRLGVFQILYDWVECGKKIPVIGNGKNLYQLLEVTDLVQAIRLALTSPSEKANDTFNVGAKDFQTVQEDVGALCSYAKTKATVLSTPAGIVKALLAFFEALNLSPLYKWVYGTADKDSFVSTEKIEAALGWSPRYSNAQALTRSYQWYLDHKHELEGAEGVTHRVAWKQGILSLFKKIL